MKIARKELNQMLAEVAQQEVAKIMISITEKTDTDPLRSRYAAMEPLDIINDLIALCHNLCQGKLVEDPLSPPPALV